MFSNNNNFNNKTNNNNINRCKIKTNNNNNMGPLFILFAFKIRNKLIKEISNFNYINLHLSIIFTHHIILKFLRKWQKKLYLIFH